MALDTPNPTFKPSPEWERLKAASEAREAAAPVAEKPAEAEAIFKHEQRREPAVCERCKRDFSALVFILCGREMARGKFCEPCVQAEKERLSAEETESRQDARRRAWEALCPEDYRDTDLPRLRADMLRKKMTLQSTPAKAITLDEIWRHDPKSPKGLGIIGISGQRKTRIVFELFRRWHERGAKIMAINAVHFADDLAAAYENGAGFAERFMEKLEKARILLIDDLGKEKLTERVEATYYRIVEFRKGHKLPLFFTANMTGRDLAEKWKANAKAQGFFSDRAEPIVRRLREMTDSITITDL